MHNEFGVHYINCGDWVESCTAIAEHTDGRFEIIVWTRSSSQSEIPSLVAAPQAA
jgi:UDP-2,3-diacylglucosamine pyrophosphatase LpxH